MLIRRVLTVLSSVALLAAPALALQPPAAQEGFVPVSQLPPGDQLPAAPLLVAAYAFVWLAAMFFMWTVWRRLRKVEDDMRALEQRRTGRGRTP
jgi:hypothetical protein